MPKVIEREMKAPFLFALCPEMMIRTIVASDIEKLIEYLFLPA